MRTDLGAYVLAKPISEWRIPDSVQALIAARIDRLPPREKSALQRAAVIGRIFWHGALVRLTPEHRQMIRLTHFQGLSVREIADKCQLPIGTVKSRTWYALRSLRLVLEEMGVVP